MTSDWRWEGGQLHLDVDIPVGTTASVHIPPREHAGRLERQVDGAWVGQLTGSHPVPAEVHLGLSTAGQIERWIEQHRGTRLDAVAADQILAAARGVIGHLSAASASVVGATARVEMATDEV